MVDRRAQLLSATAHLEAPLGIVDDDALAANADDLVRRAGGVPIRVATKSVRVRSVVEEVLGEADPPTVTGLRLKNVKTGAASELAVDGLFVDDGNHPEDYQGMYFFTDPDEIGGGGEDTTPATERPFPYVPCQKVSVRGLTTTSGKKPRVSPNDELQKGIVIIEEEEP